MQAVDTQIHHSLVAFPLHLHFQFTAALIHRFLNAGRMDTAIGDQALQGHAGHFAAGLVKAGQSDGFRRIIDDQVAAGGRFQRTDVAAFTADDAALHFVAGQRHHADGGFAGSIGSTAGDGLPHQVTGDLVALILHVGLVGTDFHCLFVSQLVVHLLEQHGAGILLAHGGNGFQFFGLAQFQLFQFIQTGFHRFAAALEFFLLALHGGGALIQRFLFLVHAALLAGDFGTAVFDLFVSFALEFEGFVLRFDDGLFALLFGGFDGIVYDALCLLLRRSDLGFGGAFTAFSAKIKTKRPGDGSNNKDHHHN